MGKGETIQVRQDLVEAVKKTAKKGRYRSLSDFVSDAIRVRLEELKQPSQSAKKKAGHPVIRERLLYNLHHIWAMVTPKGTVQVGLSLNAQRLLKGVAMIQTDPVRSHVTKETPFGAVKTPYFMFDLYSPVSGEISQIHPALHASILNDPYDITWIAEIKPDNIVKLEEELRLLMTATQYNNWTSKLTRSQILGMRARAQNSQYTVSKESTQKARML